jgi:hypothetical protein
VLRSRLWLAIVLGFVCIACSSSRSAAPHQEGGCGAEGGIPCPGTSHQVDVAFQSVAPNDTPQQATPLGISTTGNVIVWIANNAIGGTDNASNYFVFQSGPTSGTFLFSGCFGAPITSMTATLWKVVDSAQQLPPVATASSTPDESEAGSPDGATDGSTDAEPPTASACLTFDQAVLEANIIYLFGLTATGGAGLYNI